MKWRFITAIMGVTLLVLLVQNIPLGNYLEKVEHDRIMTALERDAFILAGRGEESLETQTPTDDSSLIEAAQAYRDAGGARVVIVDHNGIAVVTSDDDESALGTSYANRPEIASALTGEITSGHRFSDTLNQELLYVTVPVLSGDKILGAVRLTYPDSAVAAAVDGQLRLISTVAIAGLAVAGLVGWFVANSVTRRLRRLQETTIAFAHGDLTQRADASRGASELRALSTSFNEMAERLQGLISQQRTFAADASHQLRTPLTALRLRLERAHDLIEEDPQGAAERLAAAEVETDRLSNIIEGLLLLSRSEATATVLESQNLAAITRDRVAHWQPLAQEAKVKLRFEGPINLVVTAVPSALEQIIDNFIDNALTVSPSGSKIIIRLVSAGSKATVHVLDEGPGLSEEECVRAFDRFWRAGSDSQGSGLGLAIVAQLSRASGGSAKLSPRTPRGLDASATFTISA